MSNQNLHTIDKENSGQPTVNRQYVYTPKKEMNQTVTLDMLDCDGERRVAMIVHNPIAKRSLLKFFSPLRPPKAPKDSSSISKHNGSVASPSSNKRPRDPAPVATEKHTAVLDGKRRKRSKKIAMTEYITKVLKVHVGEENGNINIYDSCPEVVQKIEDFLQSEGVTRAMFLAAIDAHGNSLRTFLQGKDQEQCINICYPRAYTFFEKMRILEGAPKTLRRMQNESYLVDGFGVEEKKKTKAKNVSFDFLSGHVMC